MLVKSHSTSRLAFVNGHVHPLEVLASKVRTLDHSMLGDPDRLVKNPKLFQSKRPFVSTRTATAIAAVAVATATAAITYSMALSILLIYFSK
jgi:hypothetical protein